MIRQMVYTPSEVTAMFENEEDEDRLLEVTVLASDDKVSPGIASKS